MSLTFILIFSIVIVFVLFIRYITASFEEIAFTILTLFLLISTFFLQEYVYGKIWDVIFLLMELLFIQVLAILPQIFLSHTSSYIMLNYWHLAFTCKLY